MLNKKIKTALDEQIGMEAFSAALYEKMSTCAEVYGFMGTAKYLMKRADEERTHYRKFIEYVQDRATSEKEEAVIPGYDTPEFEFKSLKDLFQKVLEHEEKVTDSINLIAKMSMEESDFLTLNWIGWALNEQVEEIASVYDIIGLIDLTAANNQIFIDNYLGSL